MTFRPTFGGWRDAARRLIREGVPPERVAWLEGEEESADAEDVRGDEDAAPRVPRAFLELAGTIARHPDPARWKVLYAVLYRMTHGESDLLLSTTDPDVTRLRTLASEVRDERDDALLGAGEFVPDSDDLGELAHASRFCRGCHLYREATQTVFGEGSPTADVVLVGEQPGSQEDLAGRPFVGPAGEVLDRALAEAGIPRDGVWVTNAVKHFKFQRTPTRRIHQTPTASEVEACRPWLAAELGILRPRVVVCLGATAARAMLGPRFRVTRDRGKLVGSSFGGRIVATYHPSAVLRAPDADNERRIYELIVADLRLAAAEAGRAEG